jgi:hypothetical protein
VIREATGVIRPDPETDTASDKVELDCPGKDSSLLGVSRTECSLERLVVSAGSGWVGSGGNCSLAELRTCESSPESIVISGKIAVTRSSEVSLWPLTIGIGSKFERGPSSSNEGSIRTDKGCSLIESTRIGSDSESDAVSSKVTPNWKPWKNS